jgi:hypothetical protein
VSGYIKEKLEQKQKIDDDIQQADAVLQSKNVSIETINEHMKLNEKLNENLNEHSLFFQDIDYGKEITSKLYNIQDLEWKETGRKDKCKKHSKRISKYKDVVPLTEDIAALVLA